VTIDLRNGAVRLRPLRVDEIDAIWADRQRDATGVAPGPGGRERLARRVERSGRFVDGKLDLAIEAQGRLVGTVDARRPRNWFPEGIFEIGIGLFVDERGRGYGGAAVSLLAGYLFAEVGAHRVQATTFVENTPMRRVLEKLGWTFEGVMREFMPNAQGGRDDYALYAITKADWSAT
jgi:RimJ/RimL family protein N-acetyltransferase